MRRYIEAMDMKLEMKMKSITILEMAQNFELVCMSTWFQKLDMHKITYESGDLVYSTPG